MFKNLRICLKSLINLVYIKFYSTFAATIKTIDYETNKGIL